MDFPEKGTEMLVRIVSQMSLFDQKSNSFRNF